MRLDLGLGRSVHRDGGVLVEEKPSQHGPLAAIIAHEHAHVAAERRAARRSGQPQFLPRHADLGHVAGPGLFDRARGARQQRHPLERHLPHRRLVELRLFGHAAGHLRPHAKGHEALLGGRRRDHDPHVARLHRLRLAAEADLDSYLHIKRVAPLEGIPPVVARVFPGARVGHLKHGVQPFGIVPERHPRLAGLVEIDPGRRRGIGRGQPRRHSERGRPRSRRRLLRDRRHHLPVLLVRHHHRRRGDPLNAVPAGDLPDPAVDVAAEEIEFSILGMAEKIAGEVFHVGLLVRRLRSAPHVLADVAQEQSVAADERVVTPITAHSHDLAAVVLGQRRLTGHAERPEEVAAPRRHRLGGEIDRHPAVAPEHLAAIHKLVKPLLADAVTGLAVVLFGGE